MSISTRIAVVLAVCLPLSACKTTESAYVAPPSQSQANRGSLPLIEEDRVYIEHIERQAEARGIKVVWVNKPFKRVDQSEQD